MTRDEALALMDRGNITEAEWESLRTYILNSIPYPNGPVCIGRVVGATSGYFHKDNDGTLLEALPTVTVELSSSASSFTFLNTIATINPSFVLLTPTLVTHDRNPA